MQYRQKLLGLAWVFLQPLLGMTSFLVLYAAGVLQPGQSGFPTPSTPSPVRACGAFFLLVRQSVSGSLIAHGDLVLRTGLPKMTLAVSAVGQAVFAVLIQCLLLIPLLAICGRLPSASALAYPLLLLPLLLLGLAVGSLLAVVLAGT